jgi:hypothetical protein
VTSFSFIEPDAAYPLPESFNYNEYIETEQEMWALFPETDGKRVNFCQLGLTAKIFVESSDGGELRDDETYFLMPCPDRKLRPVRMQQVRRITLEEFRMSHITAIRLADKLAGTTRVLEEVHMQILGPEILGGH